MSHDTASGEQEYAGQRLGLPAEGTGSVASWGRRIAALFIDWLACMLVAQVFVDNTDGFVTMAIFLGEVTVFTALAGGSFAQLALRIAVIRLDGKRVNLLHALVRTVLICLVIPPVVFNRDNRGLHDLAVGTITVNR
ncbi:MAG TPA: RDD family protein [Marmoricola sp.]|nr:RDD family protein [Marmoricola sp.]